MNLKEYIKEYIKQYIRETLKEDNLNELSTMEKLLNTAERDGHLKGGEKSAAYIMDNAKKIAAKFDELQPEQQKIHRDTYYKTFLRSIHKVSEESSSGDAGAYNTPFAFSKKGQKKNKATATSEKEGMKLAPEGIPSDSKVMDYKNLTGQKKKKYKLYKEGGPLDALGSVYGAFQTRKPKTKFKVEFYNDYDDVLTNQTFKSEEEAESFATSGEWEDNVEIYDGDNYVYKNVTMYFNPEDKQNYTGYRIMPLEIDESAYNTPFAFSKKKQKKTAEQWGMKLAPEGIPSDSKVMDYKNLTGQKKKKYKLYKENEENFIPFDKSKVKVGEYVHVSKDVGNRPLGGTAVYGGLYNGQVKLKFNGKSSFISPQYVSIKKKIEESDYDKASPYTAASEYGKESGYTKASPSSNPSLYLSEKNKKMNETLLKIVKEELLNEVNYSSFKKEIKYRTKNEQLHKGIREVKRKLMEIDRIVEYTSRMKQELSEGEEGLKYWKGTEKNISQISEMVTKLDNKIKELYQ